MKPHWSAETEGRYQAVVADQARAGFLTAASLGTILFPAFSLLDLLTQHEHLAPLSVIRAVTSAIFGFTWLGARKGRYPGGPYGAGLALLVIASTSITSMCLVLDGYKSPYYAGVNLVVLAAVLLLPWPARRMALGVTVVIGIWLLAVLLRARFHVDQPGLLINNLSFLMATGLMGLAASGLSDRLRRESFALGEARSALDLRDEFVSVASHELRSPITALKMQIEVMRRQASRNLPAAGFGSSLDRLARQSERLSRLVNEMLDLSRIRAGKLQLERSAVDLDHLVTEMLDQLAEEFADKGIEVTRRIDPVRGQWDPFRIEQVVTNLLTNALKYGGGKPVEVALSAVPGWAVLEVRDHGPGIAPADRERVFQRFERATASTRISGLGLGLYITRQILVQHGGTIEVTAGAGGEHPAETDSGATFRVRLPLDPRAA